MKSFNLSLRTKFAFVATGVVIGTIISAQLKSSVPSSTYVSDQIRAGNDLIKSFTNDQDLLKSKVVTLRNEISEAQKSVENSLESSSLEDLKKLKKDLGLETLKGDGIEIRLNDGVFANRQNADNQDLSLIHAADLRDIVNLLRAAKATAITINDQRIISLTPITSLGSTILVNNTHILPPFSITAIGDFDLFKQVIGDLGVTPDLKKRLKEGRIQFSIANKKNILAPVYNGDLSLTYINEISKTSN